MKRFIIIFTSALLYGCIGDPIKNRANNTVSFVAAHVDMEALDARCNGGRLLNLDDDSKSRTLWYMYRDNYKNQCFLYSQAVEPGRYTIQRIETYFMSGASSGISTHFILPDSGKPYGIYNIKKQGIYYLGSYKVIRDKTGRTSLIKSKSPSEKQVLSEMLNHRLMSDGEWKTQINKRVNKL